MTQGLTTKIARKPATKAYVTNKRVIKRAVKASMRDQRELITRAQHAKPAAS